MSPDGKKLAYHDLTGDRIQVVALRKGATPVTLLQPVSDYVSDPYAALTWGPNGKVLAVSSGMSYGTVGSPLYIVNADGTGLSAVPGIDDAYAPTWWPE